MITYSILENIPYDILYKSFVQAFADFPISSEATYETFCKMLRDCGYDPSISIGAFDSETCELVSFVLNSIVKSDTSTAYVILTGTIPNYRRHGISKTIFTKIKTLLRQKEIKLYTTEVKKDNYIALNLYKALGFEIKDEIITVVNAANENRNISQYKIAMRI